MICPAASPATAAPAARPEPDATRRRHAAGIAATASPAISRQLLGARLRRLREAHGLLLADAISHAAQHHATTHRTATTAMSTAFTALAEAARQPAESAALIRHHANRAHTQT